MTEYLKDVLPYEAISGEYEGSPFLKYLNIKIVEKMDGKDNPWPGAHKNVMVWWKLANGKAVAWNENPGRGWTFPLYCLSQLT